VAILRLALDAAKDHFCIGPVSHRCKRVRQRASCALVAIRQLDGFLMLNDRYRQPSRAFTTDAEKVVFLSGLSTKKRTRRCESPSCFFSMRSHNPTSAAQPLWGCWGDVFRRSGLYVPALDTVSIVLSPQNGMF
jgi:hypothetical protein